MKTAETVALLQQTQNILNIRETLPKQAGAGFNIFSILDIETDERKHCRLLYEFLNPDGSHGMGDQFLREFFHILNQPYPEGSAGAVEVRREFAFSNHGRTGIVDILIEGIGFCYPIEVKINAEDQETQVKRYADFAEQRAKDSRVYYLTLKGHEPSEYSTGADTSIRISCLSFAEDIRNWMFRCGELAWSVPIVSETIRQYIALLDKLTGRVREDSFMKMVQNLVTMEIAAALPYVKAEMMVKVLREIKGHLDKRLKADFCNHEEEAAAYYTKRGRHNPLITYPIHHGEFVLSFDIGIADYLYFILELWTEETGDFAEEATDNLPSAFSHEEWKSWLESFHHERGEGFWKWLPEKTPLNFNLCDGIYPELYDSDRHAAIMEQVFAEIDTCLEKLLEMGILES